MQINGDQNEPEVVRSAFEQLAADCAGSPICKERNPDFSNSVKMLVEGAVANDVYALYLPTRYVSPKVRAFVDFFVERFAPEPYGDR